MKRENLKELGLSDDQINTIMDLNGKDIEKAKGNFLEVSEENKALKEQATQHLKDLKTFKEKAKGNEDLTKELENLQAKSKADHEELTNKISKMKLDSAVENTLSKNGVRNNKAVKALLDSDSLKLNDDGEVEGLTKQLEGLKKSDPYLFNAGEKQEYKPDNGAEPAPDEQELLVKAFKGEIN